MQMEEMLVEEYALEQQKLLLSCLSEDFVFDQQALRKLLRLVGTPCLRVPQGNMQHPALLLGTLAELGLARDLGRT